MTAPGLAGQNGTRQHRTDRDQTPSGHHVEAGHGSRRALRTVDWA